MPTLVSTLKRLVTGKAGDTVQSMDNRWERNLVAVNHGDYCPYYTNICQSRCSICRSWESQNVQAKG